MNKNGNDDYDLSEYNFSHISGTLKPDQYNSYKQNMFCFLYHLISYYTFDIIVKIYYENIDLNCFQEYQFF